MESSKVQYRAPKTGFLSYLPASFVPYAEISRIDKPIACLYLYFPCIFGTTLAASMSEPMTTPSHLLRVNFIFLLGSFLVRCAGCSWNDIIDQDFDRQVVRTRLRPMARKAIPTFNALVFTFTQVLIGLGIVILLLPIQCLYWSVPSILLTALYPYGKRFTYYPQFILGLVFSWGVIMAFPAFDDDPSPRAVVAIGCLFLSCTAWTMVYDTIYAAQDIKDDVKAGIMSPIVRHQRYTRRLLMAAALVQIALLCCTGVAMEASLGFFVCTCLGATLMLGAMVRTVNLDDPKDCIWWFKKGCFYTGAVISSGFILEYVVRANMTGNVAVD